MTYQPPPRHEPVTGLIVAVIIAFGACALLIASSFLFGDVLP